MKRREFITVFGSAVAATAWPLAVHTQSKPKRVGLLIGFAETDPEAKAWVSAFVQGMRDLGWIDGGNTQFEYHWVSADSDRINRAVTELLAQPARRDPVRHLTSIGSLAQSDAGNTHSIRQHN
jgi:putative ABC transport system substrate-binding protein